MAPDTLYLNIGAGVQFSFTSVSNVSAIHYVSDKKYYAPLGIYLSPDELAKVEHAQMCKRRDLGYLYQLPVVLWPFIRKARPVLFQPAWSSRRWKSLT